LGFGRWLDHADIMQNIDAAAMELYLGPVPGQSFEDFSVVMAAARIRF
jgi:hypothetical protein